MAEKPNDDQSTAEQAKQRIADMEAIDRLAKHIQEQVFAAVKHNLEVHKKKHGPEKLELAAIGFALYEFAQLLIQHQHIKPSPEADGLINLAIRIMPSPVVEAKQKVLDNRIIIPGR